MSMKDFDWKKFFLEKGEKVGIGVAGGLMALLVLTGLFLPGHGFFTAAGPAKNAKDLDDLSKDLKNKLATNKPTDKDDLPDPESAKRRIQLDTKRLDSEDYEMAGIFEGRRHEDTKKRLPTLKNVDEMYVGFGAILVDSYVFNNDWTKLYALKPTNKGDSGDRSLSNAANTFSRGNFGMPAQRPGAPGSRGVGSRGVPGTVQGLEETNKRRYDVVQVDLHELSKEGGLIPARQLRPLRIAELVGAFPLNQQLHEFQLKMGLSSPEAVLAERVTVTLPDGSKASAPAFRFLGVRVQRRTLDPAGKPVPGPEGQYQTLDLVAAFKPWLVLTGKRYEPEDLEFTEISWPGLFMPKLLQFRDQHSSGPGGPGGPGRPGRPGGPGGPGGPGKEDKKVVREDLDNHYPAIEGKVHHLAQTLEKLRAKKGTVEITTPPQFDPEGWDPFNTAAPPPPPRRKAGGSGAAGPNPDDEPAGGRKVTPPKPRKEPEPEPEPLTPEYCMVRVFDLNIDPGRTYQYRVQVRMANPLFGRTDVANPDWAKDEELKPEKATEWYELPETLTVPPEVDYYAVDQKELERNYKGLNAYVTPGNNETTLQIHRWLDAVMIRGMGSDPLLIGEWAVADRVIVARGEYVDRTVHIELPVWSFTQNAFVIATDQTGRSKSQHGFDIPFSHGNAVKNETILIDFEGGRQDYKASLKVDEDNFKEVSARDTSATDVLLMDPEGRLLGHNSIMDAVDPERVHRREQVQARVARVKEGTQPTTKDGKQPGKPFGGP
jgi:hypothetical protein